MLEMMRLLRKERKITMKKLGSIIGVSESAISQYETGKRVPDIETLGLIARYFGVSMEYLTGSHSESWDLISIPNEHSNAYNLLCETFLNLSSLRGHNSVADELRSTQPSRNRLIEIAMLLDYDPKNYENLIASCIAHSEFNTKKESPSEDELSQLVLQDKVMKDIYDAIIDLSPENRKIILAQIRAVQNLEADAKK